MSTRTATPELDRCIASVERGCPPFARALAALLAAALAGCGGAGDSAANGVPDGRADSPAATLPAPAPADEAPADEARGGGVDGAAVQAPWQLAAATGAPRGHGTLREVSHARHEGYDRIVFEFSGGLPGYTVRYPAGPLHQCGSGRPVTVDAPATLQVELRQAAAHDEDGNATIQSRDRTIGLPVLRSARLTCDFEGVVEWVLGLEQRTPFRAFTLAEPTRLVVDVRRP